MSKVDYKALPMKAGDKTVATFENLAQKFSSDSMKISKIIKDANLSPVGKIPRLDSSGNVKVGKPALAFDLKMASDIISAVMGKTL